MRSVGAWKLSEIACKYFRIFLHENVVLKNSQKIHRCLGWWKKAAAILLDFFHPNIKILFLLLLFLSI